MSPEKPKDPIVRLMTKQVLRRVSEQIPPEERARLEALPVAERNQEIITRVRKIIAADQSKSSQN